jgi:D-alanyl-D-alanine dipeptidase
VTIAEEGLDTKAGAGQDHPARLRRAADRGRDAGYAAVIISPSPDLFYLTGYDAPVLERLTALVLRGERDPVLLVPELERPRAATAGAESLAEVVTWRDGDDPIEKLRAMVSEGPIAVTERMWASQLLLLQRALSSSTFEPASSVTADLRARKDAGEVNLLRKAARGADQSFNLLAAEGLGGRTEDQVARSLGEHLQACGHDSVGFAIVGSGPNGASPHHLAGDRTIRAGDPVVLDFGGRVAGYCSDVTRTVSVGAPRAEVAEIHAIVHEAQEAAFRAAGPGVPGQEVDRAARRVIEDAGYGDAFIHRTGHGIGLEEHEEPYLVEGNDRPLEPGNCFSIEPGIYLPGRFGVRIEDIVTLTEDGPVRLNPAPRELTVVG